jgi:putative endonuclease
VLARNVRTPAGEIDLIARQGAVLVFAEVKTARMRRANGLGDVSLPNPLESLRHRQRMRIRRAAVSWLNTEGQDGPRAPALRRTRWSTIRFDAIGVVLDSRWELVRLDHVEGAW